MEISAIAVALSLVFRSASAELHACCSPAELCAAQPRAAIAALTVPYNCSQLALGRLTTVTPSIAVEAHSELTCQSLECRDPTKK